MRPSHLPCINTPEGIRRINEEQRIYDEDPEAYERRERENKEHRQQEEMERVEYEEQCREEQATQDEADYFNQQSEQGE